MWRLHQRAPGFGLAFLTLPAAQAHGTEQTVQTRPVGRFDRFTVARSSGTEVRFAVTDTAQTVAVQYHGLLPDLFKEGKGVVAQGQLQGDVFVAREVLAKHDENYMPPEAAEALKRAQELNERTARSVVKTTATAEADPK